MIKSQAALLGEMRELVGGPDPNKVSNRTLLTHLQSALEWLFDRLKLRLQTETQFPLAAGVGHYDVPSDLLYLLRVEWNGQLLTPGSVYDWDNRGRPWRAATAGTPSEWALFSQQLILNPGPSASALASASVLTLEYIRSAPEVRADGVPVLAPPDLEAAKYYAAILYLTAKNPDSDAEMKLNQQRVQTYTALLADRMKDIETRVGGAATPTVQTAVVVRTGRRSAAR